MSTNQDRLRDYYAVFDEWGRLETPEGALEFRGARRLLRERIAPRSRILDLGGGPGRYSVELAQAGHQMVLADLSPRLLEVAKAKFEALVAGLIERASARPGQVSAAVLREAAQTGIFRNQSDIGFQEAYYPLVGELEDLFERAGLQVLDVVSLKSIMNSLGPHVSNLQQDVRLEAERVADTWNRDPSVIRTCGHVIFISQRMGESGSA